MSAEPEDLTTAEDFEDLARAHEIDDYDPAILTKLERAQGVLDSTLEAVNMEANAAHAAVHDAHAAYIASLLSNVYALKAKAHAMGFTMAQVSAVIDPEDP